MRSDFGKMSHSTLLSIYWNDLCDVSGLLSRKKKNCALSVSFSTRKSPENLYGYTLGWLPSDWSGKRHLGAPKGNLSHAGSPDCLGGRFLIKPYGIWELWWCGSVRRQEERLVRSLKSLEDLFSTATCCGSEGQWRTQHQFSPSTSGCGR